MIVYQEFGTKQLPSVERIYRSAGWSAYLGDRDRLCRSIRNSLYTMGAFDGGELVGFIRCVGDGEHIVYVQDLIVDAPCKRQGIGTALLRRAGEKYAHVRMFALVTDAADPASNAFYAAAGMKRLESAGMTGYIR